MTLIKNAERQERLRRIELRRKPLRAVGWDFDNTLWWQKGPWLRDLQATLQEYGVEVSGRRLRSYTGGKIIAQIVDQFGLPVNELELSKQVNDRHLETMSSGMKLTPGAMSALRRCQRLGLELGGATSGWNHIIFPRLQQTGIVEFISPEKVVTREHVEHTKPHPEPIIKVAGLMGVDPQEMAFVGDEPSDVEAARRAGARAILVANGRFAQKHTWGADLVVPYLYHLNANALRSIGVING
jgi:phosphoglycolate phosphatase